MDLLGSPQHGYPAIHVAGTNGKTSVARMIDALLTALHRRTGRTTSPHLQIGDRADQHRRQADLARRSTWRPTARSSRTSSMVDKQSEAAGGPAMSKFEVLTAMAFAAFADAPVDVAVVEVGMGGRWDATNVVDAQVAVITPIGIDHADYLGNDLAEHRRGEGRDHQEARRRPGADRHRRGHRASRPPEAMEVLLRRAVERRRRGGPRGLRVRGAGPAGRRRRAAARTAGPGRGVLRYLPAAARRTPGPQRRARAGRGGGVLRRGCGAPARRRRGAGGFAARHQPRPAGAHAQRAHGVHRRGAQPGRCRRAGRRRCSTSSTSASSSASSR